MIATPLIQPHSTPTWQPKQPRTLNFGTAATQLRQDSGPHNASERFLRCCNDALSLSDKINTTQDMFKLAEEMGVKVFDGRNCPWVDELCKAMGTDAFIYTPTSKRYPNHVESVEDDDKTAPDNNPLFKHFEKVAEHLKQNAQQGLFCRANTPKDVLMHELFHVIQQKNGLPFGVNPEADDLFGDLLDKLKQPTLMGRIKLYGLGISGYLFRALLGQTEPKNDVYKAMYRHYQRECEVDKFMVFVAHSDPKLKAKLGLNLWTSFKHLTHYYTNSLMFKNMASFLDKTDYQPGNPA